MDIIVCDDHPVVRAGLRRILEADNAAGSIHEVGTAQELLDLILVHDTPCDLVLLDLSLSGRCGLEVLRQLKTDRPRLPVLILSVSPADQYAVRAIRAGASGYLTKDAAPEELIRAIQAVAGGHRYVTPDVVERLANDVARPQDRAPAELLSDREFEILGLLGRGHTVKAIATELSLSYNTINTHRTRMMAKLGLTTNADLIRFALRQGLVD